MSFISQTIRKIKTNDIHFSSIENTKRMYIYYNDNNKLGGVNKTGSLQTNSKCVESSARSMSHVQRVTVTSW